MTSAQTLKNPVLQDHPLPLERPLQRANYPGLPAGTRLVSADNHWDIADDIFYQRFPDHLKAKAPRVRYDDGVQKIGVYDEQGNFNAGPLDADGLIQKVMKASVGIQGVHDLDLRLQHLELENITAEINFPAFLLGFVHYPDLEVREQIFRTYNEYLVERQAHAPGRFYGVGIMSNWWDPARAEAAVRQVADLGLKTLMVPVSPGNFPDGKPIIYSEAEMERMWKAIEESGLPVCFHIGENPNTVGRGGWAVTAIRNFFSFTRPFTELIFGGVFDRCPKLQVVFAEGGISWVATHLQEAEAAWDYYPGLIEPLPKRRPSEYWHENMYATFQNDPLGLSLLDYIGADRVMWAVDYPHAEGTFGYSEQSVQSVLSATTPENARLILGDNARRVFKLDD